MPAVNLLRFRIALSDVERGVYENLDFRLAQHPSETHNYLLTRALAYALCFERGIEFSPGGLSDPEAPCLRVLNDTGGIKLWVEVGNPSARKVHRGAKASENLKIFTYKEPAPLIKDLRENRVHRMSEIEIRAFSDSLLEGLSRHLTKDNKWTVTVQDSQLFISVGDQAFQEDIAIFKL